MIDRDGFEALQNRWAAGEALSSEENQSRLRYAEADPLAARELRLFRELSERLEPVDDDDAPSVASALARARGVRLRVVGRDEAPAGGRKTRLRVGLAALGAGLAVAALVAVFTGVRRGPATPVVSGRPHPVRATSPERVPVTAARSELVFASGQVSVDGVSGVVGEKTLAEGVRIATAEGRACVTIDPAIDVCLGPGAEVHLESLAQARVRVRVERGTAVAALSPRSGGRTFSLVAGELEAKAHGTVFALEARAGVPERVAVLEGTVAVSRSAAKTELLGARAGLSVRAGAVDAVGRGEEARLSAWLGPRSLSGGASLGVLEIGEHGGLRAHVDDQGPYELPLRAFVGAGRHRVTLRGPSGADQVLAVDVEAGGVRVVTPADAPPETPAPSAQTLLSQARERLTRGDSRGARSLYEQLREAYPRSSEARTVLVSLGKLELEAGAAARALSTFDTYVKLGGPLLPEALAGRIKALRALGRQADEARSIEAFLARYPKSFEAPALSRRLESLRAP